MAELAEKTLKLENTEKRDTLQANERKYAKQWAESGVYEEDAPSLEDFPPETSSEQLHKAVPKFFGTMAFPYTNGTAHLGHGYTISKIEFQARVNRHLGKRVLYPQGFHVTGMPIKACADKLVNEVAKFGTNFENGPDLAPEQDAEDEAPIPAPTEATTKADVTKFRNTKKGKAALKGAGARYQYLTMLSMGVPRDQIHEFADSKKWVDYFPLKWKDDLDAFGCSIDWRRKFVTTDLDPYFNSFVEWQMSKLRALGKIKFGKRYTIFSPLDKQACLDHDRSSGEGVNPQEYTCLKAKLTAWGDALKHMGEKLPASAKVYLVPATLRPETMYGQNAMFVSPSITYGLFKLSENEYYVITTRAARNMAYQGIFPTWGSFPKVADIPGKDLIGSTVEPPLSARKSVYVLPMDTIKENKGTGVVTSVPSDSPDDFVMSRELAKKPEYYGIKAEWIPLDHLPIIETPSYGKLTAQTLVEQKKINSPKDEKQLAEAKEEAYKEGFYKGTMIYGDHTGKPVQEAKDLVRQQLLKSGAAFPYSEPDGLVISRSGDECVSALLDQWYLNYGDGDPAWKQSVLEHVTDKDGQGFSPYSSETLNSIERTLDWLSQWAVTRQFGLGTKLPWDKTQLVESLSDSTIYMAFYTVSHYLQSDLYGKEKGIANIKPEQCTSQFWEYIFDLANDAPSDIPQRILDEMRRSFRYWYALDVRVSGKDLLNNHLQFFLYIHQAIWGEKTPQYLPKGIRVNGHALLNAEKMSKSTGNFLTLHDAIAKFGADPVRVALADAGDGVEDANFDETVCNAAILKLYELRKWCGEVIQEARLLKESETFKEVQTKENFRNSDLIQRTGKKNFWDEIFDNELSILATTAIDEYTKTNYKLALKAAYYDFTSARDAYRVSTVATGGMHSESIKRYVELQAHLLAPLTPFWSEGVWLEILRKQQTIVKEAFPKIPQPSPSFTAAMTYSRTVQSNIGSQEGATLKKAGKGKDISYDPKKDKKLTIYVATSFPTWQDEYIELVRQNLQGVTLDTKKIMPKVDKKNKKAMPFIMGLKKQLDNGQSKESVFERKLPFDEFAVIEEMKAGLLVTITRCKEIDIVKVDDASASDLPPAAQSAEPGNPGFGFINI